uniref:Uncharacterized protein n=1 Tax=Lepeophtheirus salmonis TaxID=72036 RepID=A0A0K2TLW1_LEPSM
MAKEQEIHFEYSFVLPQRDAVLMTYSHLYDDHLSYY